MTKTRSTKLQWGRGMTPPTKEGVLRYVVHEEVEAKLERGWLIAADLGPTHGRWSVLMWFCHGACTEGDSA